MAGGNFWPCPVGFVPFGVLRIREPGAADATPAAVAWAGGGVGWVLGIGGRWFRSPGQLVGRVVWGAASRLKDLSLPDELAVSPRTVEGWRQGRAADADSLLRLHWCLMERCGNDCWGGHFVNGFPVRAKSATVSAS